MFDELLQKTLTTPMPANETERLAALHRYKILDTPPEAAFDRITRLAARLFDLPTALISLVDESRAWFKSCVGFDAREASRDVTLCSFCVLTDKPLIIPDTRLDARFVCNPIVQAEPGVRFYAGAPLLSHDGFNLGTLCLLDTQPHEPLTAQQQATLVDLAAMVVDELELRLAAHKVAQSEEKYRKLFESLDEGFCIVEVLFEADGTAYDHRILQANPAFERQSGILNPNGKTASELAPGLEQYWNDLYAQVVHTGESVRLETRSDAIERWFDVLVSRVGGASTCQVAIVFTDITERKRYEAALRESEELKQRILESSNDCIKVLNLESEILYISQGGRCLLEIDDPTLVLNTNWINFWQGEVQEQAQTAIAAAKAGNMSRFQGNCPTLKGTAKWWDSVITPIRDASGQVVQLVVISRDMTQQKQAEDLLRDNEQMFRNLADHAPFMVWVTDSSGYCTYLSQSWYDFTGQTPESGLGFGWLNQTHPEDRQAAEQMFLDANEQHKAFRLEYRLQRKDGEYIWAINAARPWFGVDGQFKGYVGSVIDISARKLAEAALQESEAQSRNILESITDAFFALDENWRFTYVNGAAETLLDRTRGDLTGQSIWSAYPGLAGSEFEQLYWHAMHNRVAGSVIAFYPDHERWYEVHVYPASNGITIYFRNVTEQIQTAATLRQSEERYRTLFESIDEGFCVVEVLLDARDTPIDYRILEVNPTFEQQTGLQQAIGKTARQLNLEEHWIEIYGRVALTGESIRFENGSVTLNRWFDVYACRTGEPKARKVAIVFKDISDRKLAEVALQEQTQLLQLIIDSIGDGLILANFQGEFVLVNQAAERIFGRLTNERSCDEWSQTYGLYLPDQQTLFPNEQLPLYRAMQGEYANDVEVFVRRTPAAVGRWISISGFPVFNSNGAITGGVITCRDVTERKRISQQEQAAREEAERANRIKDEFLAVLSHELRSPLNPILGWTRLLQNGKLAPARQIEALATIERNAKLQSQLIEDLLDISRIMQGKLTLTPSPVSLAFVIFAAVETVSLAADAKNIQITVELDPEVAPISGDAARLQQVVWNLLTNAVKFTANGGQVTVELRQVDDEGGKVGDRMAQIRVIDTGKGINPQFLPYVFEYFRQEDGSTTRRFGGLGLGLAIVRQIVELHGGTVKAQSQGENQGATFIVQLPMLQQAILLVPEPIQTQADSETLLKNVQILLVDDDTDTREFQAFLLEQNGAKAIAAASGDEALQVLEHLIPDVIVSDIGMAQIDGYMLMQQIRSRPPTQGGTIPAIALSAYATEIDQTRALQAGFQMHLTKPLEPEQFVSAILSLLKPN